MSVSNLITLIDQKQKELRSLRSSAKVLERRLRRGSLTTQMKASLELNDTRQAITVLEKEIKELGRARDWFGTNSPQIRQKIQQLHTDKISKRNAIDEKLREQAKSQLPSRAKSNILSPRIAEIKKEIDQLNKELASIDTSMQALVTVIEEGWIDEALLGEYAIVYKEENYSGSGWVVISDIANINQYISEPSSIRVGSGSGATLHKSINFRDTSQDVYSDIPNLKPAKVPTALQGVMKTNAIKELSNTRFNDHPKSIRIWDATNKAYTGGWVIQTSNGNYLSIGPSRTLRTNSRIAMTEVFNFHTIGNPRGNQRQIKLQSYDARTGGGSYSLTFGTGEEMSLYSEPAFTQRHFSLKCDNKWVTFDSKRNTFDLTVNRNQREIFVRAIKMCSREGQVGTLLKGEVALYQHRNYWGRAWIFYMGLGNFNAVGGLNDEVSSIRLGTGTGATVYKNEDYKEPDSNASILNLFGKHNKQARKNMLNALKRLAKEDIFTDIPSLKDSQVGDNAISAMKVWHIVDALPYSCSLSQDYRREKNGRLTEFSAFRVSINLTPDVDSVTISATDAVKIIVNEEQFSIDEDQSHTFIVDDIKSIMITIAADSIYLPALKVQTNIMRAGTYFLVFPDQAAHKHIQAMKPGALANAKDASNKPLVKNKNLSRQQIENVQKALQMTLSTIKYETNTVEGGEKTERQLSHDIFDGKAWQLDFGGVTSQNKQNFDFKVLSPQQRNQTIRRLERSGGSLRQGFGDDVTGFFEDAGETINEVVVEPAIEFGDNAINIIVSTTKETVNIIVDTVEEIIKFVAAVIEFIGVIIQKFIEFLQFLFEWADIIKTQGLLNDLVEQSLDNMSNITSQTVKPQIRKLFRELKSQTLPAFDTVINNLGGTPPKLQSGNGSASDALGEAVEKIDWVVNKISGLTDELDGFLPDLISSIDKPSGLGQLKKAFDGVGDTVIDAVGNTLDTIVNTIESVGSNPKNILNIVPSLLLIVRDLIESVINLIEQTTDIVLDSVSLLVNVCKSIINTSINIPFFSELFAIATGGKKLNLLNFSTLIIAIPLTVASKSKYDRLPFSGSLPRLAQATDSQTKDDIDLAAGICNIIASTLSGIADLVPEPEGSKSYKGAQGALLSLVEISIFIASLTVVVLETTSLYRYSDDETTMDKILNGYDIFLLLLNLGAMGYAVATEGNLTMVRRLKKIGPVISTVTGSIQLILVSVKFGVDFNDDEVFDNFTAMVDTLPATLGILRLPHIVKSSSYTSLGVLGATNLANVVVQSANLSVSN